MLPRLPKSTTRKSLRPKKEPFQGYAFVTAVLLRTDPKTRQRWLLALSKGAPLLVQLCDALLLAYVDLARLDDQGLQWILRQVPESDWLIAWKLTSPGLKERLLAQMSTRRREDFVAAVTAQPLVPRSQVVRVQMLIAHRVARWVGEGQLSLASKRWAAA